VKCDICFDLGDLNDPQYKGHCCYGSLSKSLTAERDRYREALRQVGYRAEHMRIDPKATLDDIEGIARESLNPPPKEPKA
jgi:hypothetical protein